MREKVILAACWFILPGTMFGSDSPGTTLTTKDVVQGIVARSEAVFSGKLEYHQEWGLPGQKPNSVNYEIIFTGSSWRLSSKQLASELPVVDMPSVRKAKINIAPASGFVELVQLSLHGKSVHYQHTPQPDGSVRHLADIAREKKIDDYSFPSPPFFAGTFWFACTKQFLQNNLQNAETKGQTEVNGVRAEILEWKVSDSNKSQAFHGINDLTKNGGILRVFVSPQLGYALPRVEFLSPAGKPQASFNSSDFAECSDGIFIPKNLVMQYYDAKGPGLHISYDITSVKSINQAMPDEDFVLQLPFGTSVADGRSGKGSIVFNVNEDGGIPHDLGDVIGVYTPQFWGRNWHTALILGGVLGLIVVAVYFTTRKLAVRRPKT